MSGNNQNKPDPWLIAYCITLAVAVVFVTSLFALKLMEAGVFDRFVVPDSLPVPDNL